MVLSSLCFVVEFGHLLANSYSLCLPYYDVLVSVPFCIFGCLRYVFILCSHFASDDHCFNTFSFSVLSYSTL